mmetsp:Transcript_19857/g.41796  ORF Transcript_19857/g.41796 Transcript_19857/m.41796 type:complete len:226 (-) Transcript_19857:435-1112(-)|eukprot:CAMPEP_0183732464 /NCGR_PEP_ID=MMETSP0737-20130205/38557_1 /TAXON_ID=385413 /ORGANISM="Thalassiosira miniscula, Strain CCMP1093" /LENGTH=225 /DNA_ID=CAMNT_0025965487 /DNA_START=48 /DNA_END=725 /DNA_ORIENTATION=+
MKVLSALLALLLAPAATAFSANAASASPKEALAKLVVENLKYDTSKLSPALQQEKRDQFTQLLDDLWAESKGYNSDVVEGVWTPVLSLPGKKSRKKATLVGNKVEKAGLSTDNYVIEKGEIHVEVPTPRGNGKIEGLLAFKPVSENYSVSETDGKIVLRRISVDNVKATFKYRFLPKIFIPGFKKKGGYLDFIYLDEDVRVTKGSLGGTFVNMRKEYLEKIMKEY